MSSLVAGGQILRSRSGSSVTPAKLWLSWPSLAAWARCIHT